MSHDPIKPESSVGELLAFITRAKQALSEARRPDLAARCVIMLQEDGRISLAFPTPKQSRRNHDDADEACNSCASTPTSKLLMAVCE